jgi:hypothetical protein
VLLVGVLLVAHGYYRPSHSGLYAGLAVTLAGVLCGTVQIVMPRWRGPGAGISPHDRP